MALVEGGTFTMGCLEGRDENCEDDEKPHREVTVTSFYLDRTEVTNAQYAAFLNEYGGADTVRAGAYAGQKMIYEHDWGVQTTAAAGWQAAPGYAQHPVVNVTWYGAHEYARFYGLRLPSEAEWEYAARGGAKPGGYRYSGSNNLDEVGWFDGNSDGKPHPVRGKNPNELGLFDMSGNVWEWCADNWHGNYQGAPPDSRPWPGGEVGIAVLRGGSWYYVDISCRPGNRLRDFRDSWLNVIGFRCARAAPAGGQ
ncbi:MAG: formylglycine-generating enzyme family protein [Saprospiraceae bacterium]|nr:formylglycine-generating enzyme family protein [Saprospiraceae bacterium]